MNSNNSNNIPKPKYVNQHKKFGSILKNTPNSEKSYFDKLIFQTFISLIIIAALLLSSHAGAVISGSLSKLVKETIKWNVDLTKTVDTFSHIRDIIPEGKKKNSIQTIEQKEPAKTVKNIKLIKPVDGTISSEFGERVHPVFKTVKMHNGIDIEAKIGTPIKSSTDGTVIKVAQDNINGKYIKIEQGEYVITYAHCLSIKVKEKQQVKQGDIIGAVGDTGLVSGPHLHFEIQVNGTPINPVEKLEGM